MQPDHDAARLPFWPLLLVLLLVVAWAIGRLGPPRDAALCESCTGHRELASECLCYHAPLRPDSLPR